MPGNVPAVAAGIAGMGAAGGRGGGGERVVLLRPEAASSRRCTRSPWAPPASPPDSAPGRGCPPGRVEGREGGISRFGCARAAGTARHASMGAASSSDRTWRDPEGWRRLNLAYSRFGAHTLGNSGHSMVLNCNFK